MDRSAGGVIIVFAGVVLLIAAVKGSLKNVWNAVLTPDQGGGSSSSGGSTQPSTAQTGPTSFTGGGGSIVNTGGGTAPYEPFSNPNTIGPQVPTVGGGGGGGYLGLGGYGIPAGWPGSGVTTA